MCTSPWSYGRLPIRWPREAWYPERQAPVPPLPPASWPLSRQSILEPEIPRSSNTAPPGRQSLFRRLPPIFFRSYLPSFLFPMPLHFGPLPCLMLIWPLSGPAFYNYPLFSHKYGWNRLRFYKFYFSWNSFLQIFCPNCYAKSAQASLRRITLPCTTCPVNLNAIPFVAGISSLRIPVLSQIPYHEKL